MTTTRPRSEAFRKAYRTASDQAARMTDSELRAAFVTAEANYSDDNTAAHGRFVAFESEMEHRDAWI